MTNIVELFLCASSHYSTNTAIIERNNSISYDQLEKKVRGTAAYFASSGIAEGDRVLVFVPMGIDLYRIVLALFYIGATAVFLDEWVSRKRLNICCQLAECQGFIGIFKARIFALFSKELRRIPIKLSMSKSINKLIPMAVLSETSTALITFTTGSTGIPKAADRTHQFLKEQFDALIDEIDPKPEDIDMSVLPIVLFMNLGIGSTSIIAEFKLAKPEKLNPAKIAKQIKDHRVNRIIASPFFIKKLAEHAIREEFVYEGIKNNFTGGAPVFPTEAKLYLRSFPNAKSTIVYGSTEVEPISSVDAKTLVAEAQEIKKGLLVGNIYRKTKVKIININDNQPASCTIKELDDLEVHDETVGEIIVAGPHVLKKYFKNDEAFRQNKILVAGNIWHRTGDSGYLKGRELFLTGRCKQLISLKEGYLSPFVIENELQNIDGIRNGTVLQLSNKIFLVIESDLGESILKPLVEHIHYDYLKIISTLPKDPRHNSKIAYDTLKLQLENN